MAELDIQKHIRYTRLCLNLLPSPYTSNDSNRLSLGFFLLNTLDILDQLHTATSQSERENWIDWIYRCQVDSGGFRGSTGTLTAERSIYDSAHLPAAYFAIASLLILNDDLKRLKRKPLLSALRKLQNPDGSFSPVLVGDERFGEIDVRHLYCAIATREMLSPIASEDDINVDAAVEYIRRCKGYDGGYSQSPGLESHGRPQYL
jgi:geranylgeranyl transferase type-1 subunit beta